MVVKTITITMEAYQALKSLKEPRESFSETILRVSKKRSLKEFVGALSEKSAASIEKYIAEKRKLHTKNYVERVKKIAEALSNKHGNS